MQQEHLQVIAATYQEDARLANLFSRLWLQEDIVPYPLRQQDPLSQQDLAEQVRKLATFFDEENIVYPVISAEREVIPAELVSLDDYRRDATHDDFALLSNLAEAFQGKRIIFLNATPRGGGVALMRHALIRLMRLLGVDAHWYVLQPQKEAFDITKTKFHNVLQAVAAPDVVLTANDREVFENWTRENAAMLEPVLRDSDVVVIDDPQPSGLIPFIKEINPAVKVLYRSHIQVMASLANQPETPQHTTWSYLWNYMKDADYFISHPMSIFIPDVVPAEKILYMPATTDPLDGLNKALSEQQMARYLELFNEHLIREGQTPLDQTRPYIVQVARFDPSKGIPDVLDAYRQLRHLLEEQHQEIPQLIITGNGSVDDPDGVPIYNHILQILASEPYVHFANDIKVARLPHRDQILNTMLRKSKVVLQLSTKEGFEVKVTEALLKGKPVIAYRVGGIPLQIQDGINGHLVEVGDTTEVAQRLYTLLTDGQIYASMSSAAEALANKDYLTVPNALCWLYLANKLVRGETLEGHAQWVKALASRESSQVQADTAA
jgi:glycosyltransferase involved in cell wall biosynthesis